MQHRYGEITTVFLDELEVAREAFIVECEAVRQGVIAFDAPRPKADAYQKQLELLAMFTSQGTLRQSSRRRLEA
jgi:hypothetical protein